MGEIGAVEEQSSQKIVIPEGKFAAPGDHQIIRNRLEINGRQQNLELIRQTFEGNCTEYTSLNTAIVLRSAGMAINPDVEEYLDNNQRLDLSVVETDLTIPLVLNAQESHKALKSNTTDVDNLSNKVDNPYESLTNTNSALLFRTVTSPIHKEFEEDEVISGSRPNKALERVSSQETIAVFIGSGNHAMSWIKLGEDCYHIDPYFNNGVVVKALERDMEQSISNYLGRHGSFVTLNDLYTK